METIDNIIAEMRGLALVDEESDEMVARKHMSLALSTYASRIEEAAKALVADRDNWRLQALAEGARANAATCKVFEIACAARSEPLRNCDFGTAEEQVERYMNFCRNYPKCIGCPCVGRVKYNKCEFVWAQMPYESEVK